MTRDPQGVKVHPISHPKGCRSYLVVDPATKAACVVDPLLDHLSETLRVASENGANILYAVDTHSHADHLSGAAALRERTGCEVVMHPAAPAETATLRPRDGETLALGESKITLHHAPGNAPDALVVEAPGTLFTGDTLLIGTVGLRDAPGADAQAWFETLHRVFGERDERTVVHPGHDDMGRTRTTLKQERTGNAWLRADDFDAFYSRYESDDRPTRADAAEILAANREGLQRLPRDLQATAGFVDPAQATEAALKGTAPHVRDASPGATTAPLHGIMLVCGVAVLLGTVLGWLFLPAFHGLSALAGLVLVALGLRGDGSARRRRRREPSLFYEGPVRKTIGD